MRAPLPTVAAVVLPALLLAGATRWLAAPLPAEPSAAALEIRQNLKKAPPGIAIVGNSKARTDIDRNALKAALGYEGGVSTTSISSTSAPAWYAVLEQEIFGGGYKPDLVIVYGQLGAMLRTEAPLAFERKRIEDVISGPSPVLEAKVLGDRSSLAAIARHRATEAHTDFLTTLRDVAVGLTLAEDRSAGVAAAGSAIAVPALDALLGDKAKFRTTTATRVVPIVDEKRGGAMSAGDTRPRDSLLADLVALAKANGAAIVFARAPLAPRNSSDVVDPALEAEALALLNELGASWIDLRAVDLGAEHFSDPYHAAPAGAARITAALGEALVKARVLEGGTLTARPPLLPTEVTRVGEAPVGEYTFEPLGALPCAFVAKLPARFAFVAEEVLAANGFPQASPLVVSDAEGPLPRAPRRGFGQTCARGWQHRRNGAVISPATASPDGLSVALAPELSVADENGDPVWWVYPGTRTEWRFDSQPEGAVAEVRVEARAAKGSTAVLRVGDTEVPLEPHGRLLRATVSAPVTGASWSIGVEAGRDTWLVVDEVELTADVPQHLVSAQVATVNPLFKRRFSAPEPPAIPAPGAPEERDGHVHVPLAGLAAVADDTLEPRIGRRCSPLTVTAGGAGLPGAHAAPKRITQAGRGWTHVGDEILLAPSGPAMPAGPYTFALDPKRKCGPYTWVYPGDTQVWKFGPETMGHLALPPNRLVVVGLAATTGGRPAGPLRFVVKDRKNEVLYEGDVRLPTEGGPTRVCVAVDPPILSNFIAVELRSPDDQTWFLLDEAQLLDAEHAEGCEP